MQYREKRQVKSDFCVEGGPLAADDAEGDGSDELHDEPHEAPSDELVGELRPQLVLVPYVLLLRHDLLDVSHVTCWIFFNLVVLIASTQNYDTNVVFQLAWF